MRIQSDLLEFEIDVAADAPERHRGAPSDPVGLLDVGERERLVAAGRIRQDAGADRLRHTLTLRAHGILDEPGQLANARGAQDGER